MILKSIDDKSTQLKVLEMLLEHSSSESQKRLIQKELTMFKTGYEGEKQTEYYIDFQLKDSENYYIIHDLRLEIDGLVAQIDHVLFNIGFGFILLETKNTKAIVTINQDGSLEYSYGKQIKTMPNPMEQSKRHELVFEKMLKIYNLGNHNIYSCVVFGENVTIVNKEMPKDFYRADSFFNSFLKDALKSPKKIFSLIVKVVKNSEQELKDNALVLCNEIIKLHKPLVIDYKKKFPIENKNYLVQEIKENEYEISRIKNGLTTDNISSVQLSGKYMGKDMISFVCLKCNNKNRIGLKRFITVDNICRYCLNNK